MPNYNIQYQIEFLNRNNDTYFVNILQKDFVGNIKKLVGAEVPFKLNYGSGDDNIITPIRASECECNFYSDARTDLFSFYSENDDQFRFDFYCRELNGVMINSLLWSGYVVQSTSEESFQDPPIICTLKGNDNLGLLKDISFDTALQDAGIKSLYSQFTANTSITFLNNISIAVPIIITTLNLIPGDILNYNGIDYTITAASFDGSFLALAVTPNFPANGTFADQTITLYKSLQLISKISLFDIIQICLKKTGIALPLRIFSNIYENTTQDRGDLATATMFEQTFIFTGKWLNEDGTWANCYDILSEILFPLNATLIQGEGYSNIIRFAEAYLFANNAIAGTEYDANFLNPAAVTLNPNFLLQHGTTNEFLNADAVRRITRPYKFVKETFNYEQPKQLIRGSDLQISIGAIPYSSHTDTVDGVLYRYDDYTMSTYFPSWKHMSGDTSYLEIVTNTVTDTEVERYIVTPGSNVNERGVQFNPIEVTKGDTFNFTLSFRTPVDVGVDVFVFRIKFLLLTASGDFYCLTVSSFPFDPLLWGLNFDYSYPMSVIASIDSSQPIIWDLSHYLDANHILPLIPEDGILLITVKASNDDTAGSQTTYWKEIKIDFTNYINKTTKIIGQTHTQTQSDNIKNNFDEEIKIDDSPRNTIAGTLYTNALTTFAADIGDIYFTKTKSWHRLQNTEALRLGELSTYERKLIGSRPRAIIEGTFYGVNQADKIISPLRIISIASLPGLNFICGICEFDFMANTWTGTLWELYSTGDVGTFTYEFKFLYRTN